MDVKFDIDVSVDSAIRETERYYREQIFSSGCSSLVPIYRIGDHTKKVEILLQQLKGSPYIQKDVTFSEKVITSLLDVNLFKYEGWHFFFQGDMQGEIQQFIEEQCQQISSINQVVHQELAQEQPKWSNLQQTVDQLLEDFPILSCINTQEILTQVCEVIKDIQLHNSLESYLEIFHQPEWEKKIMSNHGSLLAMAALANKLNWTGREFKSLVMLGFLKDVGYARLNEQIANFEVLHPLVSHKLILECNELAELELKVPVEISQAILMHHEFSDASGPLARMRHPMVTKLLGENMPKIAQVSGLCDLYFGFMKDYSPGIAFSITCGFVMGQGELQSRYSPEIIDAFSAVLREGACDRTEISDDDANKLIVTILNLLKNNTVRKNAYGVIQNKTSSWYERITLALNIVRNIAARQPDQLGDEGLIGVLHLPKEFGLSY